MERAHIWSIVLTAALGIGLGGYLIGRVATPAVPLRACAPETDFERFFQGRLARSRGLGARPGNEEKLLRFAPRTEYAFLYIHGFGASRAEGEYVLDRVARRFRFNTYYLRLPGHGTNPADHARAGFHDYLRESEESLCAMAAIGHRVIVVGTSLGGLLATHVTARYPERVQALVLASPFFDFASPLGRLLDGLPEPVFLAGLVVGPVRHTGPRPGDVTDKRIAGYERFWYADQHTASLQGLIDLRHFVSRAAVFRQVQAPVLLLYHYRSESDQDGAASVPAMLEAFGDFGRARAPQPLSRPIAIARGSHVLMSRWVRADHERVEVELTGFVESLRADRSRARPAMRSEK